VAKIQRKVLTLLESLYRFTSSQEGAPGEVELGLGITPVHDLSRMAEIGAASIVRDSAGYWLATVTQTHVATGTAISIINLTAPPVVSEGWTFNERQQWAWVIGIWGTVSDVGDFQDAGVLIENIANDFFVGPSVAAPNSVEALIWRSTSAVTDGVNSMIPNQQLFPPLPALILSPQDGLRFESTSDNLGTISVVFNAMLWVGQRNTFPPGMY